MNGNRLFLVSCVSSKRAGGCPAKDLYTSDWFVKARRYVEAQRSPWFILSAKHGLLPPDAWTEPYEQTLNRMAVQGRRQWAARVIEQIRPHADPERKAVVLAGARYREFLLPQLRTLFADVDVPMHGLRIGQQLAWLTQQASQLG